MRVTSSSIGAQTTARLQEALAALVRKQGHISSGRRVELPSDDPTGFAQVVTLRSSLTAAEAYGRTLGAARGALQLTEATLGALLEMATQAKESAVAGASANVDTGGRQALATTVSGLLEDLVSAANAQDSSGRFLFGGQETMTAPYTVTRDGSGAITAVTVNPRGVDGANVAEVADGVSLSTSMSGTSVFGASTDATYAFDVLIRLRDALLANDGTATGATLDDLSTVIERITSSTAEVGTRLGWLSRLEARHEDEGLADASALARIEDLDMVKAIQEFQQAQTTLEAALSSSAKLLQLSLVNFLR